MLDSWELDWVPRLCCAELNLSFWSPVHSHRAGGLYHHGRVPKFGASTSRVRTDSHVEDTRHNQHHHQKFFSSCVTSQV